jgi:hypothetical protein
LRIVRGMDRLKFQWTVDIVSIFSKQELASHWFFGPHLLEWLPLQKTSQPRNDFCWKGVKTETKWNLVENTRFQQQS